MNVHGKDRVLPAIILNFSLLLTVLVYWPGLSGGFLFDDYSNILFNERVHVSELSLPVLVEAAFSGFSGLLLRPISMLSFGLNIYWGGFDPFWFKLTNLCLHLLTGIAVYFFLEALLAIASDRKRVWCNHQQANLIAVTVTAAWLLHPLNLTAVLYVVQRMAILSALFVMLGLYCYLQARLAQLQNKKNWHWWTGVLLSIVCALLSKENGVLLIPLLLLTELLFRFETRDRTEKLFLVAFHGIFFALPLIVVTGYTFLNPDWIMEGYAGRSFNLIERLLTETRVIWMYVIQIVFPEVSRMSLLYDNYPLSRTIFDPPATIVSLLALLGILTAAMYYTNRAFVFSFGVLFFLTGHLLESTIFPLELVFEHRNYLPLPGLLLILIYYLSKPVALLHFEHIKSGILILFIGLLLITTSARAFSWSNNLSLVLHELENNPDSIRANMLVAQTYTEVTSKISSEYRQQAYELAVKHYHEALRRNPQLTEAYAALLLFGERNNQKFDTDIAARLIQTTAETRLSPGAVMALKLLFKCMENAECGIDNKFADDLIKAVRANPILTPQYKHILYTSIALYLWERPHDIQGAIDYTAMAIEAQPDYLQNYINYAQFALKLGELQIVEGLLHKINNSNTRLFYAGQIKDIENQLAEKKYQNITR